MRPASSAFSSSLGASSSDYGKPFKSSNVEIERASSATGQEREGTAVATGQVAGGNPIPAEGRVAHLSLSGLKVTWPASQLILAGVKTVEARSFPLGRRNIAQLDVEMWLMEAPPASDAISPRLAVCRRPGRGSEATEVSDRRHSHFLALGRVREPPGLPC